MTPLTDSPNRGKPIFMRLPGLVSRARLACGQVWRRIARPAPPSCVFHITHHKAGSQWIRCILEELTQPWLVTPQPDGSQFLVDAIQHRHVYPTLYLTREQFESVAVPPGSRRFVVIRDLRDTLISAYFSLKVSHHPVDARMARYRSVLHSMGEETALIRMIRQICTPIAAIQQSWLNGPDEIIKYEDLLVRDEEILTRVLLEHCRIPASRNRLLKVAHANRFESRTGGRKRGSEDIGAHERKGVAGDWKNHFTDRVARAFKERFAELLVATGYEQNDRW